MRKRAAMDLTAGRGEVGGAVIGDGAVRLPTGDNTPPHRRHQLHQPMDGRTIMRSCRYPVSILMSC